MAERERLGRYILGHKLGEGGMGIVWQATVDGDPLASPVAIKRMHDVYARDPGIREMFLSEARTARRLQHGNVVRILEVGDEGGAPFLVLELVEGVSLAELLRAHGARPLPPADAIGIAEAVASALAYAHGLTDAAGRPEGVVHRDVTPRNILLSRDGVVKLADFGIAKALAAPSYTVPGTFKGSVGYVAPEQALGKPVDARADQFALGIVLHEMLAGANPVAAKGIEAYGELLAKGVPALAPDGLVDAALAGIVGRATSSDPAARYANMDELRGELEAWRVGVKLRTSNESLRTTMRAILGDDATVPSARALGDALFGAVAVRTAATQHQAPGARDGRRRSAVLAAVGVAAVIAIAAVAWFALSSRGGAAPVDARIADARPPDAALDAPPDVVVDGAAVDARVFDAVIDARPIDAAVDAAPIDAVRLATPPKRRGILKVNVVPYANVYLDGKLLGGVPVVREVEAGDHELVLENSAGARVARPIRVEPDKELEVISW